ncbi:MAG: aspartate kinase [Anaerolineae bacterium]|nr:aspartate kinase [Anaerolineae bacterium]
MKQSTLIMKFGGTSVGSIEAIRQVIGIASSAVKEWREVVIVSSAFAGVTSALLASAVDAARGVDTTLNETWQMLIRRHREAVDQLVQDSQRRSAAWLEINALIEEFVNLGHAILVLGEATPRALDAVAALGERLAVRVLAAALTDAGIPAAAVDATQLIITNDHYQAAVPDMSLSVLQTRQMLGPLFAGQILPVVTGFIGATADGVTTTLGRGGSDYSAALLGVALEAGEVWIWTDVDGVMTADPRLARDARTITSLSYREVAELAYFGAKVLHPKTIRPVIEADIQLRVLNTFNPSHPGTCLTADHEALPGEGIIKAVTAIRGVQLVTLEGRGMLGVPGVAARIFSTVANTGATVPLITEASSEQSITFAVPMEYTRQVLKVLEHEMRQEIMDRNIDRVWATEEVVIVTAVCPGMRQRLGVAGKMFGAMAEAQVNVLAIAHGSSEVSISIVVSVADMEATVAALHHLTQPLNGDD